MGIFMEEVFYNTNNTIEENTDIQSLLRENQELTEDNNELISEQLELILSILNDKNGYLNENNWWTDLGYSKEDLEDPKTVTQIINDIKDHKYDPELSDQILNFLYGYCMLVIGTGLGGVIGLIISIVMISKKFDRTKSFIKKTEKGIRVLEKRLRSETDPKMKKEYKHRIEVLKKNKEKLEKSQRSM